MSAFLKHISIAIICLMDIAAVSAFAQCSIKKTKINKVISVETPEKYQYTRLDNKYYAISVKTVLQKKANGSFFHTDIKYTGDVATDDSTTMIFKFQNGSLIKHSLMLLGNQKTDNVKLITKVYRFELKEDDLAELRNNPLKEVELTRKNSAVAIPVNDPLFMQEQIICLQNEL